MLVDPDVGHPDSWEKLSFRAKDCGVKLILVGGSFLHTNQLVSCIESCKKSGLPVWIFPGSGHQICTSADGILLLSLLSGRNPDFLIGHHVAAAQKLHQMDLEIIPTAYVLVDGGIETAVQRVSKTQPIPHDNFELLQNTVLAGAMIGNHLVYLDAGSGAVQSVPTDWIVRLIQEIDIPIVVGGGIRDVASIEAYFNAGANVVVIGNHVERNPEFLGEINRYLELKQVKL
jgi:putative glycerol-1-phosphate prenyltransferase